MRTTATNGDVAAEDRPPAPAAPNSASNGKSLLQQDAKVETVSNKEVSSVLRQDEKNHTEQVPNPAVTGLTRKEKRRRGNTTNNDIEVPAALRPSTPPPAEKSTADESKSLLQQDAKVNVESKAEAPSVLRQDEKNHTERSPHPAATGFTRSEKRRKENTLNDKTEAAGPQVSAAPWASGDKTAAALRPSTPAETVVAAEEKSQKSLLQQDAKVEVEDSKDSSSVLRQDEKNQTERVPHPASTGFTRREKQKRARPTSSDATLSATGNGEAILTQMTEATTGSDAAPATVLRAATTASEPQSSSDDKPSLLRADEKTQVEVEKNKPEGLIRSKSKRKKVA